MLDVINRSASTTLKDIAKEANVSQSFAKKIKTLMSMGDEPGVYEYNNLHSNETVARVEALIDDRNNQYLSAAGFKREIPERVSKKFIRRKLHEKGYKYRRIKPKPKKASNDRYEHESLPETISFIAQALGEHGESIFFLDEVKFPLHCTGEYCWVKDGGNIMFNDRLDNMTLHVIALCSKNGFVAFQIFLEEITATVVLYFLT